MLAKMRFLCGKKLGYKKSPADEEVFGIMIQVRCGENDVAGKGPVEP